MDSSIAVVDVATVAEDMVEVVVVAVDVVDVVVDVAVKLHS